LNLPPVITYREYGERRSRMRTGQLILLVEDDKSIALGLAYALEQEGYRVTVCHDKASALKEIQDNEFDLAILDITLPDGNGYHLCRTLRASSDIPVIFLTVLDDEANVVAGLDMGADDYVRKPFRLREVLSRVRSVLRRAGSASRDDDRITIRNLTIYTKQARVLKNGEEITLTALEYRLLLVLAQNKGHLLTRNRLLEEIWDISGEFVNDNTLTVYIKRLREKIEDDPQNPALIKTVRGLGYRMD
jgi:DNA-binding response OmpR family regulator